jgi:hypothetical protein
MPAISGRYARPVLSAQAALVVDRGTAPTFMKEFSSQLERFARHPAPPADAAGPAGRRSADARLVLTVGKDPPRASSGGWKRAVCPVLVRGGWRGGSCPAAGGLRARTAGQAGAAAPLAVHPHRVRGDSVAAAGRAAVAAAGWGAGHRSGAGGCRVRAGRSPGRPGAGGPGGHGARLAALAGWAGRAGPVGYLNSATHVELGFYTRSYSLRRPPRTGRRLIRSGERPALG